LSPMTAKTRPQLKAGERCLCGKPAEFQYYSPYGYQLWPAIRRALVLVRSWTGQHQHPMPLKELRHHVHLRIQDPRAQRSSPATPTPKATPKTDMDELVRYNAEAWWGLVGTRPNCSGASSFSRAAKGWETADPDSPELTALNIQMATAN